jgi:hypothetical protein
MAGFSRDLVNDILAPNASAMKPRKRGIMVVRDVGSGYDLPVAIRYAMGMSEIDPERRKVLLSTSILVDLPEDEDKANERACDFDERLRESVAAAFQNVEFAEPTGVVAFDWLAEPGTNVGKCARCNCWVTNRKEPRELRGLATATIVNGELICDQCFDIADGS